MGHNKDKAKRELESQQIQDKEGTAVTTEISAVTTEIAQRGNCCHIRVKTTRELLSQQR